MGNKKYITYEEFGAKGDGVADDFIAMRAAHAYANEVGLPVKAKDDATYYIHDTRVDGKVEQIVIKTDTEWGSCNIVIDDRDLDYYESDSVRQMCVTQVFRVASDYEPITNADRIRQMTDEELAQFLVNFKNTFGEEYEGEMSCLEWLKDEVEGEDG